MGYHHLHLCATEDHITSPCAAKVSGGTGVPGSDSDSAMLQLSFIVNIAQITIMNRLIDVLCCGMFSQLDDHNGCRAIEWRLC